MSQTNLSPAFSVATKRRTKHVRLRRDPQLRNYGIQELLS
jgi:hypothetical protein